MKYLRVLFVEDNPLDVELLIRHIKKGDFEIEYDIATSLEEVSDLTDEYRYDICICDYKIVKHLMHLCVSGIKTNRAVFI